MAKVQSHMHSSIRGRVGGVVYTKNQYAAIVMRAFVAPTNPGTTGQELARTAFAEASGQWEILTQAQRDGWDDYAKTAKYPDPHGNYYVGGRQQFCSNYGLALFIEDIGGSSIAKSVAPPTTAGFENIGVIQPATYTPASKTGISVSIGNPNAYDLVALVHHSLAYEPSKNTFYGPYPHSNAEAIDLTASSSTTHDIELDSATAGKHVFVRVRILTENGPHRTCAPAQVLCVPVTNGP